MSQHFEMQPACMHAALQSVFWCPSSGSSLGSSGQKPPLTGCLYSTRLPQGQPQKPSISASQPSTEDVEAQAGRMTLHHSILQLFSPVEQSWSSSDIKCKSNWRQFYFSPARDRGGHDVLPEMLVKKSNFFKQASFFCADWRDESKKSRRQKPCDTFALFRVLSLNSARRLTWRTF